MSMDDSYVDCARPASEMSDTEQSRESEIFGGLEGKHANTSSSTSDPAGRADSDSIPLESTVNPCEPEMNASSMPPQEESENFGGLAGAATDAPVDGTDFESISLETTLNPCANCMSHEVMCFCRQCAQDLCAACDGQIHNIRMFKSHQRVDLSMRPELPHRCEVHKDEVVKLFCSDPACRKLVCILCAWFGSHRTHASACIAIEDIEASERVALADHVQSCSNCVTQLENRVASLNEAESARRENSAKVLTDLNDDFALAIELLQSKRVQISEEVSDIVEGEVADIRKLREEAEQHLLASKVACAAAEDLLRRERINFLALTHERTLQLEEAYRKAQVAIDKFTPAPRMSYQEAPRIIADLVNNALYSYDVADRVDLTKSSHMATQAPSVSTCNVDGGSEVASKAEDVQCNSSAFISTDSPIIEIARPSTKPEEDIYGELYRSHQSWLQSNFDRGYPDY